MKKLNQRGLKKLIAYLEAEHPTLKGKLKVIGERLILDDSFHLYCLVEEDVPIIPPDKAETETEKPVGKSGESAVKMVGRAGIEREKEKDVAELAKKLSKEFPTRNEVEKRLKETGTQKGEVEKALQDVAAKLQVR